MEGHKLASYLDHTLLRANCTQEQIEKLCIEAKDHSMASVCVPPNWVDFASKELMETRVKVCTVAGFPLGYQTTETKLADARNSIELGADEIDVVMNISAVKSGNWGYVEKEIKALTELARENQRLIKLILETCYLEDTELKRLCELCNLYKPDFAKTSTGFGSGGADIEVVGKMNNWLDKDVLIKASGGISSTQEALDFINQGASRLGTSRSLLILSGL